MGFHVYGTQKLIYWVNCLPHNTSNIILFSRQESQSRGSDETLSSPRSPEGNNVVDYIDIYMYMYTHAAFVLNSKI